MASACSAVLRCAQKSKAISRLFKPSKSVYKCLQRQCADLAATQRWQLYSAVCLERYPVITQELSPLEEKFQQMTDALELENSLLSNHELQQKADLEKAERRKKLSKEELEEEKMAEAVSRTLTSQDKEDMWEKEFQAFQPTPRITDADRSDDRQSLHRKLNRKLILIVKQKLGDRSHWTLPMGAREEKESMREAAERILQTTCGQDIQCRFLGNAPCGFFKFKVKTEDSAGNKVFFFKAMHDGGNVSQTADDVLDYKWVTKEELKEYLDSRYLKTVKLFFLEF